ncbi:hypothetical protein [Archangium sp.]|uniref:hypothetical protein n=1 Tax=Archangium sp. TaxID=1872627 RepID=UPI00286C54D4|nr:hypothetical protein [Archangium sp.]
MNPFPRPQLKESQAAPAEVKPASPPSAEASWFPGFVWEIALCAACGTHLGWCFHGESDFLGLVLDRLTAPS